MENEKEFMMTNLISTLIKDEWDAIEGYNGSIATLSDEAGMEDIISILEDIRDEEYVHVGQLESCLSILSGDPTEHIEDGSEEGFEQLELPEEDEEEFEDKEIKTESMCLAEDDEDGEEFFEVQNADGDQIHLFDTEEEAIEYAEQDEDAFSVIRYEKYYDEDGEEVDFEPAGKVWSKKSNESLHESEKPTKVSEQEMKKVICSMIKQYDASEEEVFDEIQSADPKISKDTVHRLYQMCTGKKQTNESLESSFDEFWEELDDLED